MRSVIRIVALAAVVAASLLPATAAQAASYFKSESGGVEIELHVVDRKIAYLRLEAPVTCDPEIQITTATVAYVLGQPIPIGRNGGFFYSDTYEGDRGGGYRARFHGTILNGVIDAEYEYALWDGSSGYCWSGDTLAEQGTPGNPPTGSPVPLSVHRKEGLRFYSQDPIGKLGPDGWVAWDQKPHIYMWIGGGKVYGLTAHTGETCWNSDPQPGSPSVWRTYQAWLRPTRPLAVDPKTNRFRYRKVNAYPGFRTAWRLGGLVDRQLVRGSVGFNERGAPLHCQTGGRNGPAVRYGARRG